MSLNRLRHSYTVDLSEKLSSDDSLANGVGNCVAELATDTKSKCSKLGECTLRSMRSSLVSETGSDRVAIELECGTKTSDDSLAGCVLAETPALEMASEVEVFVNEHLSAE